MKLVFVAIAVLVSTAAAAKPQAEISEGIEYLKKSVPKLNDQHLPSGEEWTENFLDVVQAIATHPKYSQWLDEDEGNYRRELQSEEPMNFPCKISPSNTVPTSVHKLTPGDIKVVSGFGDSLTAANGAGASSILGLLVEYRGKAFSMGGQDDFSRHSALPNIFKLYNNAYGYSTGNGNVRSRHSVLNLAEPGKKAADMPQQARDLVTKMKADSKVDFQKDWKLITLFIGGNDVCDSCKDKALYHPDNYIKYIREALDYLHKEVPRAFVNVLEVLDVSLVKELKDGSSTCSLLQGSLLCRCAAFPQNGAAEKEITDLVAAYQDKLRTLVNSGRYDTRGDFTVVNQPFFRNTAPPRLSTGKYDFSFFAPDCFHFSSKGHAESGKALWNNMLEAEGRKSTQWNPNGAFNCPTAARPYLATRKN